MRATRLSVLWWMLAVGICGCGDCSGSGAAPTVDSGWGGDGGPPVCPSQDATGFHVTLDGTSDGDGSLAAPWDTALAPTRRASGRTNRLRE